MVLKSRVYPTLSDSDEGLSEIVYVAMRAVNKKATAQGKQEINIERWAELSTLQKCAGSRKQTGKQKYL